MAPGKVYWVPLESNPELYTSWSQAMGLDTSKFAFVDIYGLDDELLAMVPQPVEAVLCLFPVTKENAALMHKEDANADTFVGPEREGEMVWFKQTIGNACGTIGLLHSIANSSARSTLSPDSPMGKLLRDALPLSADERAAYLQTSHSLQQAHTAAAVTGQTTAPAAEAPIDNHFVAYVRDAHTGKLFELDGRRKGPVNRGVTVPKQDDLLKVATAWVQKNYMSLNPDEHNFNLIALTPTG